MSTYAIQASGLGKRYRLGQREPYKVLSDVLPEFFARLGRRASEPPNPVPAEQRGPATGQPYLWALRDVSFAIRPGEVIGVIGHNGSGKSTLLKILSRITGPTEGMVELAGRVGSLLEVGTGFHPELTGRENIYMNGIILGMKRAEVGRKFDEIVAFAEMDAFIDTPVKRYSSGMYMRLAFAVAAHLEPEILIVDEVLSVGDAAFQKKCLGKMDDVARHGRTVLFVSHQMSAIQRLCQRTILLERGQLVADGETDTIVARYLARSVAEAGPGHWIDTDQMMRRGDGSIRVTALRYASDYTALQLRPYTHGPLEVTLALQSDAPRVISSAAITIYDRNGLKLVNADTLALGRTVQLRQGENRIRFAIEALHLSPGSYTLGWWLGDALGNAYDYVDSAFTIDVVDPRPAEFGTLPESNGVVACSFDVAELA